MDKRLSRLEQRLGPTPAVGRLVFITPNSWSDADRESWERAEILPDTTVKDDLIEKHTGIRPTRRPGVISIIVDMAPASIENADEATRAAWRKAVC
jgi:hypothetical protein